LIYYQTRIFSISQCIFIVDSLSDKLKCLFSWVWKVNTCIQHFPMHFYYIFTERQIWVFISLCMKDISQCISTEDSLGDKLKCLFSCVCKVSTRIQHFPIRFHRWFTKWQIGVYIFVCMKGIFQCISTADSVSGKLKCLLSCVWKVSTRIQHFPMHFHRWFTKWQIGVFIFVPMKGNFQCISTIDSISDKLKSLFSCV
jgi:hypothetical protein